MIFMIYEYRNKKGKIESIQLSMKEEIPKEIEVKGEVYKRVWSCNFYMPYRDNNRLKKDMDDYSQCSISKKSIYVNDKKNGKVKAHLRIDKDGKPEMVYKTNPCKPTSVEPSMKQIEKLSKNMEKFI